MRKRLFTSILAVVFALSMTFTGTVAVFAEDAADTTDTTIVETEGSVSADDITLAAEEDIAEEDVTVAELDVEVEDTELVAEGEEIDAVAKIGDVEYETLDEALAAAKASPEGSVTIEILGDCTADKNFNAMFSKNITFTGSGRISVQNKTYNNGHKSKLTVSGAGLTFDWNGSAGGWLMLATGGNITVDNGATFIMEFDSAKGANCAFYLSAGSAINVLNGSTMRIQGHNTKGVGGQAFQLETKLASTINVSGGSSLVVDGTNRGYVNSPVINVTNSTLTVQNCTSNASNGGKNTYVNSVISYLNNNGHGISADSIDSTNSTIVSSGNRYYGIGSTNNTFTNSSVTVENNGYNGLMSRTSLTSKNSVFVVDHNGYTTGDEYSGMNLKGTCDFDDLSVVTVTNNANTGIVVTGTTTIAKSLTVTTNNAVYNKNCKGLGGGIRVADNASLIIPRDAKVYNNHADLAGDDIYVHAAGSIAFGPVGTDWVLDDCECPITGWFYDGYRAVDSADDTPLNKATADVDTTRWSVKGCELPDGTTAESTYAIEFTPAESNAGILALKAAHGVYRVSYHDNVEGTVFDDQNNNDLNYGDTNPAFQGEPTRDGYEFIGWTDEEGGDVVVELPSTVVGDADYYAVWKKIPATNPDDPGKPGTGSKTPGTGSKTPGTSDMTDLMGYISLMGASILGIYVMVARRRKENA
ncbi:MAG: InlB B-repeat-containing protein [Clostridiales bacterium]|nr:InlB B-repeat-containing protein [Candidatus Crickella merdequi]